MGLIHEETNHPELDDVSITVSEIEKGSAADSWQIVSLDVSFATIDTPQDLILLGKWLIDEGKRIKKQYTSRGKIKAGSLIPSS